MKCISNQPSFPSMKQSKVLMQYAYLHTRHNQAHYQILIFQRSRMRFPTSIGEYTLLEKLNEGSGTDRGNEE